MVLGGELFKTGFLLRFDVAELVKTHGIDVDGVTAAVVGAHCFRFEMFLSLNSMRDNNNILKHWNYEPRE